LSDRNTFLSRIREAAARGRAHRVAVNPQATHEASYVGGGDDKVATFLNEWIAVGGRGARVRGDEAARQYVADLLISFQAEKIVRWKHPLLERLELDRFLADRHVTVHVWDELESQSPAERWPIALAADLGITSVDWAVAETGTLALCSHPGQGRVVSLLPPNYLAIIEPSQIVPDLFDLFTQLEPHKRDLPSNLALVTGPSKTGDIELKLTTGVHGPGNVHVLVVEE
jgi:L-lactate dehydrogenase complex protein LldG